VASAVKFIREELGERISLEAWYHDSLYRYVMTDSLQPIPVETRSALRPEGSYKADRRRYLLVTHGSHLVDMARYLGGAIASVRARRVERFEAYCWFVDVEFADGSLGHLALQVPVRGDFEEGFRVYGEHGSVEGRIPLPWYHKSSEVCCFSARDRSYRRVLGEDAHTYRRQVEGFAAAVLGDEPQVGADAQDGLEAVRTLVAIARSAESGQTIRVADAVGGV
jgi:predicted dehydrogenase